MDEQAPLLAEDRPKSNKVEQFSLVSELRLLARRTVPICAVFALQNTVQASSVVIAGSLSPFAMEVTSYGFMFFSCTGTMVAIGGTTALDTLCAHAFASQAAEEDPQKLGLLLQQCIGVLLIMFAVIITPIWVFSNHLFLALGQEPEFALVTGRFMVMMIPAGALQVCSESFKKFLQVQGASSAVGWVTFATSLAGIVINVILVKSTNLSVWSGPVSFSIYQLLTMIFLLSTIFSTPDIQRSWRSSPTHLLQGLPRLLFYALTGICTIATEWWSFEILAMMAAKLDRQSIGAQSILMSSDLFLTTVSLGISVAASHRIGGLLGSSQGWLARRAALCPYILSLIVGGAECMILMTFRNQYGRIFTEDSAVTSRAAEVLPLLAVFQLLDLSNGGAGGILRGAGMNHISGLCNFVAYYGVGLTGAWFFCFRLQLGLFGLWAGIILGSVILVLLLTLCVRLLQWDELGNKISSAQTDL